MLTRLNRLVDRILEWLLIGVMSILVVNVLWQVFTRFVLRDPSTYTEELARFLLIWVALLGAAYAVGKRLHLAIDYFTEKLSGRRKLIATVFTDLCVFLFALLGLVIGGVNLVTLTLKLEQVSAALQVRLGYVYLVLPLSGLLIMFYSGVHLWECLRNMRAGGEQTSEPKQVPGLD